MKDYVSKLTLYDILAMVLPGWVLINEVAYLLQLPISLLNETLYFAVSYALGMVLFLWTEKEWKRGGFRNNPNDIKKVQNECAEELNQKKIMLKNNGKIIDSYYSSYEKAIHSQDAKEVVKAMERQIAFGRSMIIPILFSTIDVIAYYARHYCICNDYIMAVVYGIVIIGIIAWAVALKKYLPYIQKKIYRAVFEYSPYIEPQTTEKNETN